MASDISPRRRSKVPSGAAFWRRGRRIRRHLPEETCSSDVPPVVSVLRTRLTMSRLGSFVNKAWRWYGRHVGHIPISKVTRRETVICVGCQEDMAMLDTVLEPGDYDLSFLSSTEGAYPAIVRALPSRVILCMRADDEGSLRLLSMLSLDRRTAGIRVVTCVSDQLPDIGAQTEGDGTNGLPSARGFLMH